MPFPLKSCDQSINNNIVLTTIHCCGGVHRAMPPGPLQRRGQLHWALRVGDGVHVCQTVHCSNESNKRWAEEESSSIAGVRMRTRACSASTRRGSWRATRGSCSSTWSSSARSALCSWRSCSPRSAGAACATAGHWSAIASARRSRRRRWRTCSTRR